MSTDEINAPADTAFDESTRYPERYAILMAGKPPGVATTLVYQCRGDDGREFEVGRTYARDASGLHTDPRWPADAIVSSMEEADPLLAQGKLVAVPVPVAQEYFKGLVGFAVSARHPTLGVSLVP